MSDINLFLKGIASCDQLVFTRVSEAELYCRFYSKGSYKDRVFVTDSSLLRALSKLQEDAMIAVGEVPLLTGRYCYL